MTRSPAASRRAIGVAGVSSGQVRHQELRHLHRRAIEHLAGSRAAPRSAATRAASRPTGLRPPPPARCTPQPASRRERLRCCRRFAARSASCVSPSVSELWNVSSAGRIPEFRVAHRPQRVDHGAQPLRRRGGLSPRQAAFARRWRWRTPGGAEPSSPCRCSGVSPIVSARRSSGRIA